MNNSLRPDLTTLSTFALVVETGNFSRAAERLGVSKSVVTRRVVALEEKLDVRLFNRTTHSVTPTDVALAFHQRCQKLLDDLDDAVDRVTESYKEPRGQIRMTAPLAFTTMHLMPAVTKLLARYPELTIQIEQDDRYRDLAGEGFDLAIRIGELKDSTLVARQLASVDRVVVCSQGYADEHGVPDVPRDLQHHDCLVYTNALPTEQWRFWGHDQWESIRVSGRFAGNNAEMLRDAALKGLGIAALPEFVVSDEVHQGGLVPLLRNFPLRSSALYAVYPPARQVSAKVRAVIDFLAEYFSDDSQEERSLSI